tara:strand:+ start:188 stop:676 length:489 start_codon:yes stop_codon:yes gene_type:complete
MKLNRILQLTVMGVSLVFFSFTETQEATTYKCMIQLTNYTGEGAYIVVSLLDEKEEYEETLYVQGEDAEWFSEITRWWKFYGLRRPNIDAISGPTVSGGNRTVNLLKIPTEKIDAGYILRFETSVEDQSYYPNDVQFELTQDNLSKQTEGRGFIRYIRMIKQ